MLSLYSYHYIITVSMLSLYYTHCCNRTFRQSPETLKSFLDNNVVRPFEQFVLFIIFGHWSLWLCGSLPSVSHPTSARKTPDARPTVALPTTARRPPSRPTNILDCVAYIVDCFALAITRFAVHRLAFIIKRPLAIPLQEDGVIV